MGVCMTKKDIDEPVKTVPTNEKQESVEFRQPFKEIKEALRVFHFNDVYEIEDNAKKEISKGAPRFITALKQHQKRAVAIEA